jgi:hypothetical protein
MPNYRHVLGQVPGACRLHLTKSEHFENSECIRMLQYALTE